VCYGILMVGRGRGDGPHGAKPVCCVYLRNVAHTGRARSAGRVGSELGKNGVADLGLLGRRRSRERHWRAGRQLGDCWALEVPASGDICCWTRKAGPKKLLWLFLLLEAVQKSLRLS